MRRGRVGEGGWDPKDCVAKMAGPDFPDGTFRLFPRWSLWSGGGGGSHTETQREVGCGRPEDGGGWTAKTVKRPRQQPAQPQYANAQTAHPATSSTAPAHQTTGPRERGNDTSQSTGRSGQQNAATRRYMRRGERVTVQGPVTKQRPDGMSHRGSGGMMCWILSFRLLPGHRYAIIARRISTECCLEFTASAIVEYFMGCLVSHERCD